jgi:hypothetical protein
MIATNSLTFDLIDALRSPVLTNDTSWADCIPKRILEIIPIARLKAMRLGEQMATLPECIAYIMTRSMIAPMTSEWVNIYTYLGCKVCQDWFGEDHWDKITDRKTLSNYEEEQYLKPLRRHIYEKRRQLLKYKFHTIKEIPVMPSEMIKPDQPVLMQLELNLF